MRIFLVLVLFVLLATSCQPAATSPPPPTATSSPPTATSVPTESPSPAATETPAPTLTPISPPTSTPTIESGTESWRPALPKEPCIPGNLWKISGHATLSHLASQVPITGSQCAPTDRQYRLWQLSEMVTGRLTHRFQFRSCRNRALGGLCNECRRFWRETGDKYSFQCNRHKSGLAA